MMPFCSVNTIFSNYTIFNIFYFLNDKCILEEIIMKKKKKQQSSKNNRSKKSTFSDSNSFIPICALDDDANDIDGSFSMPFFYVDSDFDDDDIDDTFDDIDNDFTMPNFNVDSDLDDDDNDDDDIGIDNDINLHQYLFENIENANLNENEQINKNFNKNVLAEQIATDIPPYQLGSKKTVAIHRLVDCIIDSNQLVTITGGIAFAYQKDLGCYQKIISLESFVVRLLSISGHYIRLSNKEIKDMCEQIRWYPFCAREHDAFNNNPQFINMENGVLDYVTDEVFPHDEKFLFTYVVRANYLSNPNLIHCPSFDHFCQTSLAPLTYEDEDTKQKIIAEKRQLLLEIIGYICCDNHAGKCAFFLKGEPDSGKSVVANFITQLFQPELISNVPLHKLSERFFKAELFGKKLNVAGEIQGKQLTEIATFKSITGGDAITGEYKGKNPFSFTPRCKLLFAGNALPGTSESDATKAFVNRLIVLLFNHSIPKEKQDKDLLKKLWNERDSIFTLAMQALKNLHERNYRFTVPAESSEFIKSFVNRNNSLQMFLQDCCVFGEKYRIHNTDLMRAYTNYCTQNGLDVFSKKKLYEMLSGYPGVYYKKFRIGNRNAMGHIGIALKDSIISGTMEQTDENH